MIPFAAPWYGFLGVMAVIGIILHLVLRGRTEHVKRLALTVLACANVVLYTWYTFNSILSPDVPEVVLAQNLPFHFCNIVAWALIPAAYLNAPRLQSLCFFPGTLAALLTLTSPVPTYIGKPVLSLPSIGFYGVHSMNVVLGILLASLALYTPTFRDSLKAAAYFVAMACVMLPVDALMRAWIDPHVNYFYVFEPEGADLLVALHDLIPIPLVYELPFITILLAGVLLQAAAYTGIAKASGRAGRPGHAGRATVGADGKPSKPSATPPPHPAQ